MTFADAVKILGLEAAASKNDIKNAYRALVVKNHPDKFQDEIDKQIAEKNFKRIQEAYDFLIELRPAINIEDRVMRSGYDKDADAIRDSLDELLKIKPLEGGAFSWSDVSSTQGKIIKIVIVSVVLYIIAMIVFFSWGPLKGWFGNLF